MPPAWSRPRIQDGATDAAPADLEPQKSRNWIPAAVDPVVETAIDAAGQLEQRAAGVATGG